MRFVIVTGMSGSGKTAALKMLEDDGYFCVDNLPLELIGKFAELAGNPAQEYSKVAVGFDSRSMLRGHSVEDFFRRGVYRTAVEHSLFQTVLLLRPDKTFTIERMKPCTSSGSVRY